MLVLTELGINIHSFIHCHPPEKISHVPPGAQGFSFTMYQCSLAVPPDQAQLQHCLSEPMALGLGLFIGFASLITGAMHACKNIPTLQMCAQ